MLYNLTLTHSLVGRTGKGHNTKISKEDGSREGYVSVSKTPHGVLLLSGPDVNESFCTHMNRFPNVHNTQPSQAKQPRQCHEEDRYQPGVERLVVVLQHEVGSGATTARGLAANTAINLQHAPVVSTRNVTDAQH